MSGSEHPDRAPLLKRLAAGVRDAEVRRGDRIRLGAAGFTL